MAEPTYRRILVVDLLGGIGDLLMVLPAVHALARRNPGAAVHVLTHEPGADLLRGDPSVAEVRVPEPSEEAAEHTAERRAVARALAEVKPDLAVTTTRYGGIPDLLAASGARCVDDLWRSPPPDEPVGSRYLRILHEEGLVEAADLDARTVVHLDAEEVRAGRADLAHVLRGQPCATPIVLLPQTGMDVKRWPAGHWRRLAALARRAGHPVLAVTPVPDSDVPVLPPDSLRRLGARFAAVAERDGVVVGGDTGPLRLAAAVGAATVGLFGPTSARRYGVGGVDLQGLPACPHRLPTAITEQVCWWEGRCPLSSHGPACMADLSPEQVARALPAAAPRRTEVRTTDERGTPGARTGTSERQESSLT